MHILTVSLVLALATPVQDRRDLYDEKADASAALEAARTKAASENRRVLVVWGANDSEACRRLDEVLNKDAEVAEKLSYEYDLVRIAAGANAELARRLGADVEKLPSLTVFDAKGTALANQETSALVGDPKRLLEFLTRHQAPYEKAEDIRARALRDASAAGKKLLLTFGAPW